MFSHRSSITRTISIRLMFAAVVLACLGWLALWHLHAALRDTAGPASTTGVDQASVQSRTVAAKLEGEAAKNYLARTGEGQSLMKALTSARFGLEQREQSPFAGDTGAGYLGMSHDENLNAWFDDEGVTVRPTLPEQQRAKSWRMRMRLRAYGYGAELHDVLKQTAPTVKENRIEYERAGSEAGTRVIEWYVNKAEGIEQGFTLEERPRRGAGVPESEPLRLAVSVTGDLRARASEARDSEAGQAVELHRVDEAVLSYSKLVAFDATGTKLAARMETSAAGDEIALVVDDKGAQYPIVVDPITATQKQELAAVGGVQPEARFGFSVAIDGFLAVVGAWREDHSFGADQGAAYFFVRTNVNPTWTHERTMNPAAGGTSSPSCGWSVAVDNNRILVGCPGFSTNRGHVQFYQRIGTNVYSSREIEPIFPSNDGDRFGESLAIGDGRNSGTDIIVGAPFEDLPGVTDVGRVTITQFDQAMNLVQSQQSPAPGTLISNSQFGRSVAMDNGKAVIGQKKGDVHVFQRSSFGAYGQLISLVGDIQVTPSDFGNRLAINGDIAVVADPLYDTDGGVDAGAIYVYDLTQIDPLVDILTGQILTASDGRTNDYFSEHAVAVEGNTIVVGAYANGQGGDPINGINDDDRGAAYVFTRSGTVWTQQAKISQGNFAGGEAGDHFGIDVDISNETVLIGARGASSGSNLRAGAAFIYELDCVAPYDVEASVSISSTPVTSATACPGGSASVGVNFKGVVSAMSFQWRKDGVNIPGANGSFYNISNLSSSAAGSYDAILSTACGTEISSPATLNVHAFSLNPASQNFSASGSNGIVNVTSTGSCGWTATSNASWINITSGPSGTGNGTVGFTVAANSGAQRTGSLSVAGETFTVTQDGAVASASTVQFSQSVYSISEGAGGATVTVTRTGNLSSAVTVEYATTDGTATDRGDYNTTIGRLRFAAGEAAKNFTVLLNDDVYAEGTQSLNLTLSNPTGGAALGSPFAATLSIVDNDASTATANPLDSTGFFVRQQYVDFFSREADAPGLSFWTNNIDSCGANAGCREVKRIDTSAAFFLSIEFQETGFLVHRLYRSSFGRLTRYREFIRDLQEIGRGVVVNSPGWEALLEANKQAFIAEFVARADFQSTYGGMTNAQYVDALNANTGGSLSTAERNALVAGLNSATETRATALRKVAEDADFRSRETSPAFVLLQYFGYLRRNPDDPPEPGLNFDGYNFWLGKLNSFGGDFRRAEMVKSFLVSAEYRNRFGP